MSKFQSQTSVKKNWFGKGYKLRLKATLQTTEMTPACLARLGEAIVNFLDVSELQSELINRHGNSREELFNVKGVLGELPFSYSIKTNFKEFREKNIVYDTSFKAEGAIKTLENKLNPKLATRLFPLKLNSLSCNLELFSQRLFGSSFGLGLVVTTRFYANLKEDCFVLEYENNIPKRETSFDNNSLLEKTNKALRDVNLPTIALINAS